jgi:ketosteroid isomerase-like protein
MLTPWRAAKNSWSGSRPRCTTQNSPCTTATPAPAGPSGPRNEPVSVLGAWRNAYGQREIDELFTALGRSFSDCTSYAWELQAYDVVNDMAFTVGLEHTSASVDGDPRSYTLRATQVYRREGGEWKVAHRHADTLPPPR